MVKSAENRMCRYISGCHGEPYKHIPVYSQPNLYYIEAAQESLEMWPL